MRIIIGNQTEDTLQNMNSDDRIFSQRVIWFAKDDDVIILSDKPDITFLKYATSLTGTDLRTLKFLIPPQERFSGKHFDQYSLTDKNFISEVLGCINEVTEIIPMWPSPAISHFAKEIGLLNAFKGAQFFSQYGVELVNNKAYFRALSASANIPIALGEVCHDIVEAKYALRRLLKVTDAVIIKQVHNGAGVGNELIIKNSASKLDDIGAKYVYYLKPENNAINKYLTQRWNWASFNERHPVVIEKFQTGCQTIYAEFYATDSGICHTQTGRLGYQNHRLVEEIVPLDGIPKIDREKLIDYGSQLAKLYQSIGYRGYLSADALIDKNGNITFTEMNARIGGSLHIYNSIGKRVVKYTQDPKRAIAQYHAPLNWRSLNFDTFLTNLEKLGYLYDPNIRKGVIIPFPILPEVGGFVSFCIVYQTEEERNEIYEKLDNQFRT
ncbi:hypothetical protein NIE88_09620 [Sporolactobacillus shoreicorticis]|uniref:ATP-grasp domain-containing protein n=1 Tax=Sporolactobacillus shoreicorticis TaxID=1923877 RepID=A0ABW5S997_9BACL|nr:hypothetical protein [Sporolactobacillus shoreicorticis]MCO7126033.1 hypothetical protein [Sporolactobacillus shoreicorticis]